MARVNVYLPDELADAARRSGVNVSQVTQQALRAALEEAETDRWLDDVAALRPLEVTHERVLEAVSATRDDFGA